jgi:hypothetical protein
MQNPSKFSPEKYSPALPCSPEQNSNSDVAAAACDMNEFSTLLTRVEFWIDASDSAVAEVSEGKFGAMPYPTLGYKPLAIPPSA